jgi:hypothetical protein
MDQATRNPLDWSMDCAACSERKHEYAGAAVLAGGIHVGVSEFMLCPKPGWDRHDKWISVLLAAVCEREAVLNFFASFLWSRSSPVSRPGSQGRKSGVEGWTDQKSTIKGKGEIAQRPSGAQNSWGRP